jgi:hypothetical protein
VKLRAEIIQLQTDGSLVNKVDENFRRGMQKDAFSLKDPAKKDDREASITQAQYKPDWSPAFLSGNKEVFIDGVILVAGSGEDVLQDRLDDITVKDIEGSLQGSIRKLKVLAGKQRDKKGEEKNEQ